MKQLIYVTPAVVALTMNATAQNIFVSNWGDGSSGGGTISEFDSSGHLVNPSFATGLSLPWGMAFNSVGNLFVANFGNSTVSEFNAGGNLVNTISGFNIPLGLAIDAGGNLYVGNAGTSTVMKFNSSGTLVNGSFISGLTSQPSALTFDSSGNLYVATFGKVSKFNSNGTLINGDFVIGLNSPYGMAFDHNGNLFVGDQGTGKVSEYNSSGTLINGSFALGLNQPFGVAIDGNGNLYTGNADQTISEFNAVGNLIRTISNLTGSPVPSIAIFPVPEPSTWALAGLGAAASIFHMKRKRLATERHTAPRRPGCRSIPAAKFRFAVIYQGQRFHVSMCCIDSEYFVNGRWLVTPGLCTKPMITLLTQLERRPHPQSRGLNQIAEAL